MKKNIADALETNDAQAMKALRKDINRLASSRLRRHYKNLQTAEVLSQEQKRLEDVDTVTAPPFDTVIVAASSARALQTIISLFSFYDITTKNTNIYGLQLWDEMPSLKNDPSLFGAHHITIDSPHYQDFRNRYYKLFGKAPPTLVSLVYDATMMALNASQGEGRIDPSLLHSSNGYSGVGSQFRFMSEGTVERLYGIKLINGEKSRVVQVSPKNFPDNY